MHHMHHMPWPGCIALVAGLHMYVGLQSFALRLDIDIKQSYSYDVHSHHRLATSI